MIEKELFTEYFLVRLIINMVSMAVLVRGIYYHTYHKKDSFFTFFLLNFIVFLLSYMLEKTGAFNSLSSAFGLLAAFSLLRFRTETISLKDMTYLFIIMTFGLINAVMKSSHLELIGLNGLIVTAVFLVDGNVLMRNQKTKIIEYPSLDNIKPEQYEQLMSELREKTGLDIRKIVIESIDFVKSRVTLKVFYY
jgi:Domain of unknown function (DUF4956)